MKRSSCKCAVKYIRHKRVNTDDNGKTNRDKEKSSLILIFSLNEIFEKINSVKDKLKHLIFSDKLYADILKPLDNKIKDKFKKLGILFQKKFSKEEEFQFFIKNLI